MMVACESVKAARSTVYLFPQFDLLRHATANLVYAQVYFDEIAKIQSSPKRLSASLYCRYPICRIYYLNIGLY